MRGSVVLLQLGGGPFFGGGSDWISRKDSSPGGGKALEHDPKGVAKALSLPEFKKHMDKALRHVVWFSDGTVQSQELELIILMSPFQLKIFYVSSLGGWWCAEQQMGLGRGHDAIQSLYSLYIHTDPLYFSMLSCNDVWCDLEYATP